MNTAEAWDGPVGRHWAAHSDRYDAMLASFDAPLFDAAAIQPGDRVVDIGCGSGHTTRTAARHASPGRVVGVDISAPLIERARALTGTARHPNVSYEWGDAQVHPFERGGYDVVISRGGVMFFADHVAAFTRIGEALRPGGRLAFICPQPSPPEGEERRALGLLASLLRSDHAVSDSLATAMSSLSDPRRTGDVLAAAGFEDVETAPVTAGACWGKDAADAVDFFVSRAPGPDVTDAVRAAMVDVLLPYETSQGVLLRAGVWVVTARRPS